MVKCPKCFTEVEDGAKFCDECGAPIPQEKKCPKCGAILKPMSNFVRSVVIVSRLMGLLPPVSLWATRTL